MCWSIRNKDAKYGFNIKFGDSLGYAVDRGVGNEVVRVIDG